MIAPEPYSCPPITDRILDEYTSLMEERRADSLRAWIREADKACRANEQLLNSAYGAKEVQ